MNRRNLLYIHKYIYIYYFTTKLNEYIYICSSEANRGLICPLDEVVKSPVLTHYRNKCEFTIGHDFDGQRTIGFLLGLFREGVTVVLGIEECVHVPEKAKAVVKHFQVSLFFILFHYVINNI